MTFKELGLTPALLRAVSELDYVAPSPIQQKAIPPVLAGRDLIGCAQTGTGKTAAFAVPILQRMQAAHGGRSAGKPPIRALVLTPTRELALQIKESFDAYGKYLPIKNTVIFGGVGQGPQVSALQRGVEILVATPGRLNDLINQGYIALDRLEYFVLDEADRMLDMGFLPDVRRVLRHLPPVGQRQTLLFSATMPPEIEALARQILNDPIKVAVTPVSSTVDAIRQQVYKVDKANKRALLLEVLQDPQLRSVLVFTRTKHGADRVARELTRAGIQAMAIHGNKSQNARQDALERFKTGRIRVLVATDIAARGIDIDQLACVINYELPNVPETYVHRIGRTGRAGRDGLAISFCMFDELPYLADIEKLIRKKIPEVTGHPYPMQIFEAAPPPQRPPRSPQKQGGRLAAAQEQAAAVKPRSRQDQTGRPKKTAGAKTQQPKTSGAENGRFPQPLTQKDGARQARAAAARPGPAKPAGEKARVPQTSPIAPASSGAARGPAAGREKPAVSPAAPPAAAYALSPRRPKESLLHTRPRRKKRQG